MIQKTGRRILALLSAVCVLLTASSCQEWKQHLLDRFTDAHQQAHTDQVVLFNRERPTLGMVMSDELLEYMNHSAQDSLSAIKPYFELVVNEEIEENVVYIRARGGSVSDSDFDERLVPANVYMQKVGEATRQEAIGKVLDASSGLLNAGGRFGTDAINRWVAASQRRFGQIRSGAVAVMSEAERFGEEPYQRRLNARKAACSKILSRAKTAIKTALPFGEAAVQEAIARRTAQLYRSADDILSAGGSQSRQLKYMDYCIASDDNEIAVVCGSLDCAGDALDYIRTQYLENGEQQGDFYIIDRPEEEVVSGTYIDVRIAGSHLEEYSMLYAVSDTYYDGEECAAYLNDYFLRHLGRKLTARKSEHYEEIKHKLVVGKTVYALSSEFYKQTNDICAYEIRQQDGDLYLLGGSDWALQYAADYLIDEYFSKNKEIPKNFDKKGSIYGKYLFEKYEGANLRLMTSNIWDKPVNTQAWKDQGADCSNNTRIREVSKVYMAYNPDVLALQEMNHYFLNYLVDHINDGGRKYKVVDHRVAGKAIRNFTPLIYNTETVELLDSESHAFRFANNSNTKSYTWGYFEEKKTGKRFLVFSTHLWWKKDTKKEPKNSYYRQMQIAEVCAKADEMIEQFDCPCFIMGDFNCTASSKEFSTLSPLGFSDCYHLATRYAEDASGKYVCNSKQFSFKMTAGGYSKSIDHITAKRLRQTEILTYDYVTPNFYGRLSDHAPLYIDLTL